MVSAVRHEESQSPIAVFNDLHYLIEIEVAVAFGFEEVHRTRYSISVRYRRRDYILERVDPSAEGETDGEMERDSRCSLLPDGAGACARARKEGRQFDCAELDCHGLHRDPAVGL